MGNNRVQFYRNKINKLQDSINTLQHALDKDRKLSKSDKRNYQKLIKESNRKIQSYKEKLGND